MNHNAFNHNFSNNLLPGPPNTLAPPLEAKEVFHYCTTVENQSLRLERADSFIHTVLIAVRFVTSL